MPVTSPLLAMLSPALSALSGEDRSADCLMSGSPRKARTTGASPGAHGAMASRPAAMGSIPKYNWAASLPAFGDAAGVRSAGGKSTYGKSTSGVELRSSGATNSYLAYGSKRSSASTFFCAVSASDGVADTDGSGGIGP